MTQLPPCCKPGALQRENIGPAEWAREPVPVQPAGNAVAMEDMPARRQPVHLLRRLELSQAHWAQPIDGSNITEISTERLAVLHHRNVRRQRTHSILQQAHVQFTLIVHKAGMSMLIFRAKNGCEDGENAALELQAGQPNAGVEDDEDHVQVRVTGKRQTDHIDQR